MGQVPSEVILRERDRLRSPDIPLESVGELGNMISRINSELSILFPQGPELQLRLTATDCESILDSVIPHYKCSCGTSIPAGRHGTGLLSLQTLMLLLEFGRFRNEQGKNFILAIEEPELHLPPGLQRILIHRIKSVTAQSITTTHSPSVAAFYPSTNVLVLENRQGDLFARSLLDKPLTHESPNSIRKLLRDNRQDVVSALMQERVLIPEGRIDFEWLRFLSTCTETQESWELVGVLNNVPFGTMVGIIPTHDASVIPTFNRLSSVRSGLVIIVDGDNPGNDYIRQIIENPIHPLAVIQWPNNWVIEDVLLWVIEPNINEVMACLGEYLERQITTTDELKTLLITQSPNGIKGDYQAYECITNVIMERIECLTRARQLLDLLCLAVLNPNDPNGHFVRDGRSVENCPVLVWSP